jgi:hypothetical protein
VLGADREPLHRSLVLHARTQSQSRRVGGAAHVVGRGEILQYPDIYTQKLLREFFSEYSKKSAIQFNLEILSDLRGILDA